VPEVNVRIGPFTVDFLWPEVRLVVETDGYAAHRGRQAFEDDRARDLELRRRGYEVMRFTDSQINGQPAVVAGAIRRAVKLIACPPTRARSGSPSSS
jgi:very-short-patch-repair endonuclease